MTLPDHNIAVLILCGGKSTRMGKDKYLMNYYGIPQWKYLYTMMRRLDLKVFVSCNEMQANYFDISVSKIVDSVAAKGPALGILSAHAYLPEYSWIVIACDTPLVSEKTFTTLLLQRDKKYIATAYKNPQNNLPEPLIALWEKEGLLLLKTQALQGIFCPRKLLINANTQLINPNFEMELYNANTEEDCRIISDWILQQKNFK